MAQDAHVGSLSVVAGLLLMDPMPPVLEKRLPPNAIRSSVRRGTRTWSAEEHRWLLWIQSSALSRVPQGPLRRPRSWGHLVTSE